VLLLLLLVVVLLGGCESSGDQSCNDELEIFEKMFLSKKCHNEEIPQVSLSKIKYPTET
jgi:hypothetical protein